MRKKIGAPFWSVESAVKFWKPDISSVSETALSGIVYEFLGVLILAKTRCLELATNNLLTRTHSHNTFTVSPETSSSHYLAAASRIKSITMKLSILPLSDTVTPGFAIMFCLRWVMCCSVHKRVTSWRGARSLKNEDTQISEASPAGA